MPTPLARYEQDIKQHDFAQDPAQRLAVIALQQLYEALLQPAKAITLLDKLKVILGIHRLSNQVPGIYLWGGVGRGKTYLMDCFYQCLPFDNKLRLHFYRFMQQVHQQLKELGNVAEPLELIADDFSKKTLVLCFDEFHVADITDAMLLAGLLKALFDRGVVLVATSNQHPDALYKDGLQRARFLPAIALLKQQLTVINIDSDTDYRLRFLDQAGIYYMPLDDNAVAGLNSHFRKMSPDCRIDNEILAIAGREIPTVCSGNSVVWFEFSVLCNAPRGAADYIEIARQFQTVLLANIPILTDQDNDLAKRFIVLVDELYDRQVKLIISAAAAPDKLYSGKRLQEIFQRTQSRLIEMQTHDYLGKPHLP